MTRWLAGMVLIAAMLSVAPLVRTLWPDPMLAVLLLQYEGGHGSGFAVDAQTVVTNRHVMEDDEGNLIQVTVVTVLGGVAVVKKVWRHPTEDIAVLTVAPALPHSLDVVCDWPRRGERVRALGHPLGTLWGQFTGRVASDLPFGKDRVISLDVGVNHGMSGGPVVDWLGRAVAVTKSFAAASTGGHATGLAVPGDTVCEAIAEAVGG